MWKKIVKMGQKIFFGIFYIFPIIHFNVRICMLSFRIFICFLEKYLFSFKKIDSFIFYTKFSAAGGHSSL